MTRPVRARCGAAFLAALATLFVTASGCRQPPTTSPEFAEASALWARTVDERGFEAGDDPRAAEALALLEKVPAESYDAQAAATLAETIRTERKRRAELARPVTKPMAEVSLTSDADAASAAFAPPAPSPLVVGSDAAAFRERYGDCVKVAAPFVEAGGARSGDAWERLDTPECTERFPELEGQYVFVAEGRIFNVAPKEAGRRVDLVPTDAGFAPVDGPVAGGP